MQLLDALKHLKLGEISDIYITPEGDYFYKRLGEIIFGGHLCEDRSLFAQLIVDFLPQYLDAKKMEAFYLGIEQNFSLRFGDLFIRVHAFLSEGNPALNLRILPSVLRPVPIFEKLPSLKESISHTSGLFLIAGATGCGKSTSASHILRYLADLKPCHIVCIEDPIEYRLSHARSLFSYREVGRDTRSFESGILCALRQDVDVIFVGELRGQESLQSALLASQTGHFVLATIHGGDVSSVVLRFLSGFEDMARASYELAQSLCGVLMQYRMDSGKICYEFTPINAALRNLIREQKFNQINSQAKMLQESFSMDIKER